MNLLLLFVISVIISMSDETGNPVANKVSFQKSNTRIDSVEFVSIQLESATDSIEALLEKAMNATRNQGLEQKKVSLGAIT